MGHTDHLTLNESLYIFIGTHCHNLFCVFLKKVLHLFKHRILIFVMHKITMHLGTNKRLFESSDCPDTENELIISIYN